MAAINDPTIATQMVQQDIFTALLGLLGKDDADTQPPALIAQCLATMAYLCETVDVASKAFTRHQGLAVLLDVLQFFVEKGKEEEEEEEEEEQEEEEEGETEGNQSQTHTQTTAPQEIISLSLQTLRAATENNYPLIDQLCRHPYALPFLLSPLTNQPTIHRPLICSMQTDLCLCH